MPYNIFSGSGAAMKGLTEGAGFVNDWTDRARDPRAGYRAAPRIASGDYAGAAGEYASEGMAAETDQMAGRQRQVDQQDMTNRRQVDQDEIAAAGRRVEAMTQIATGLREVPAGQRHAALQRALPVMESLGVDVDQFAGLTEDQLHDANLTMFAGELEKQWQFMNLGNGGAAATNTRTGAFELMREPDPPPVIVSGGAVAVDRGTGKVVARNPKTFAPQRPRSDGGGLSGVSTADLVAAVRGSR